MASIVKRCLSGLLAGWFAVFSVLLPLNASAATFNAASNWSGRAWYVPATGTGVAGSAVVASAASALARANPWVAALTIGTPIMQYLIEQRGGGNVQVAAGANVLPPTPPGWSDANTPPASATPTEGGTPFAATQNAVRVVWKYSPAPWYDNQVTACQEYVATKTSATYTFAYNSVVPSENRCVFDMYYKSNGSYYGAANVVGNLSESCFANGSATVGTTNCFSCPPNSVLNGTQCVPTTSCPSGYAVSGGQCVLTDTPLVQWPSDGVPTMIPRVGEGGIYDWWPSDRDPDAPSPATGLHLKGAQYFTDQHGNTIFQQITPLQTGGVQIGQMLQQTVNGQTVTTINDVQTGPDGVVVRSNQRTVEGDIPTVSSTDPTGQQSAIKFPDDYNREITQQKILTGEDAPAPSDWASSVTQQAQDMNDALKQKIEEIPDQFGQDKASWFSWVWTPPVGECSPFNGTIHGNAVSWDICPYIATTRDVIGWLFALFGAWSVYNQMFRKEDA